MLAHLLPLDPDQDDDEEGGEAEEERGQQHEQYAGVFLVQLFRRQELPAIRVHQTITFVLASLIELQQFSVHYIHTNIMESTL